MNEQIESIFVNTYIRKQYRERLLFELKDISDKTRKRSQNAFGKFSHSAEKYVIPGLVAKSDNRLTEREVLAFIKKFITEDTCYYMDEYGCEEMPINTAVEKAFDHAGASVIVYKNIFSIIKEETEIGSPKKIILVNQ